MRNDRSFSHPTGDDQQSGPGLLCGASARLCGPHGEQLLMFVSTYLICPPLSFLLLLSLLPNTVPARCLDSLGNVEQ